MRGPITVIFHPPPRADEARLSRLLAEAREDLVRAQVGLFERAGSSVVVLPGRREGETESFGERLRRLVSEANIRGPLIVLGSGAVPLLRAAEARLLVQVGTSGGKGRRVALTNNRYSSDICGVSDAAALRDLPPLPSDNALPRWLEEAAGFDVRELRGRMRLALDIDTPLDLAVVALAKRAPQSLRELTDEHGLEVPRLDALRSLAADPRRELLVFGRSGSRTLAWLERNVRCRVRFLAEERGLRASSQLAIVSHGVSDGLDSPHVSVPRPPSSTLGLLVERDGPDALAGIVSRLADGALIDSRVLIAHHFGPDEDTWPSPEDRYASDLLLSADVHHSWLRALTAAAEHAAVPIQLGSHTLVGPGIRLVLGSRDGR